MASIATTKGGAERPRKKSGATAGRPSENERTETVGRFWLVVMMPVVITALVALIMFYLTLPLR